MLQGTTSQGTKCAPGVVVGELLPHRAQLGRGAPRSRPSFEHPLQAINYFKNTVEPLSVAPSADCALSNIRIRVLPTEPIGNAQKRKQMHLDRNRMLLFTCGNSIQEKTARFDSYLRA